MPRRSAPSRCLVLLSLVHLRQLVLSPLLHLNPLLHPRHLMTRLPLLRLLLHLTVPSLL